MKWDSHNDGMNVTVLYFHEIEAEFEAVFATEAEIRVDGNVIAVFGLNVFPFALEDINVQQEMKIGEYFQLDPEIMKKIDAVGEIGFERKRMIDQSTIEFESYEDVGIVESAHLH